MSDGTDEIMNEFSYRKLTSQYLSKVFSNCCLLFVVLMLVFSISCNCCWFFSLLLNILTVESSCHVSTFKHYDIKRFLVFLLWC